MSSICEDIMRNNGLKGFFRGFWATFNRDFFTTGLWFYIFFQLRDYYEEHNKATFYNLMFAGGVSGVVSWLVTYPFDILKSIIQIDKRNPTLTQREAYILLKNQPDYSTKRLFKGLGPTLTRAFYSNAVLFYVNEIGQNYFNGKGK
jgi:solute carrier family 25 carnitine/acylcarnitine transporter 20/29